MAAMVDELERLIGPPLKQPPPVDWAALETALGTRLPVDYKVLAGRYADLELADFLSVPHPGMSGAKEVARARMGVLDGKWPFNDPEVDYFLRYDDEGRTREVPPLAAYPAPGGLLMWGATENGDVCAWLTGPDPDSWHVAVGRGVQWWFFEGGMLDFLVGILSRTVRCPLITDEFPEALTKNEYLPEDFA